MWRLPVQGDVHAKSPTVVVVVVVINQQIQTTISRRRPRQRAADEERLAVLSVEHANVADQCADAGTRDRPRADDRAEARAATTLGSNRACTLTGDNSTGGRERDLITGAYINARVNAARVPGTLTSRSTLPGPRPGPPGKRFRDRMPPLRSRSSMLPRKLTVRSRRTWTSKAPRASANEPAVRGQKQPSITIGSELATAAKLDNRRARLIANRADQLAFGSVRQRRGRIG